MTQRLIGVVLPLVAEPHLAFQPVKDRDCYLFREGAKGGRNHLVGRVWRDPKSVIIAHQENTPTRASEKSDFLKIFCQNLDLGGESRIRHGRANEVCQSEPLARPLDRAEWASAASSLPLYLFFHLSQCHFSGYKCVETRSDLLQGIPLGLAFGSVPFLLQQSWSIRSIGFFTLTSYPYSLKLLWSPIVDTFFSHRIGRRRSWILPIQACLATLFWVISDRIQHWIDHVFPFLSLPHAEGCAPRDVDASCIEGRLVAHLCLYARHLVNGNPRYRSRWLGHHSTER